MQSVRLMVLASFLCAAGAAQPDEITLRFAQEVQWRLDVPAAEQDFYASLLQLHWRQLPDGDRAQFVLLVDKSPHVQAALLFWKSSAGEFRWIGASPISTGKPGRFEYFETPAGIFEHSYRNPDYRAEGTKNEQGIRGYGRQGMRVFDFGWQPARQGWGHRHASQMRLQMHATDPDQLEPFLGSARSKGCIRIHASLNTFLDHYGILDADYELASASGQKPFVLQAGRTPVAQAGRYLIVVGTNRQSRPSWSPLPQQRRAAPILGKKH